MVSDKDILIKIKPIGVIHSPFKQASGTPIQAAMAKGVQGVVEIHEQFAKGLKDLEGFERIWLIYWFHKATGTKLLVEPYMSCDKRGLFATRAPCRPNPIGLSAVRLLKIKGCKIYVADIDILDGSPLLDIKPYASKFDHFEVKRSGWLDHVMDCRKHADNRFYTPGEMEHRL